MGLFDGFNMDDPQTMGLLSAAAGMLNASGPSLMPHSLGQVLAQGAQGGMNGYKNARDAQREQMQMDMLKQQIAQATRKNTLINNILEQSMGGGGATSAMPAAPQLRSDIPPDTAQGFTAPADRFVSPPGVSQGSQGAPGMAGVSPQAIGMDIAFNDGKNVGSWINDRTKPNMAVHNGFAVDMTGLKPGFLPQLNVSQNGQTSMVTIGPDGLPTVSAPNGAVNTVKGYTAAGEQAKNENTLAPLDRINPKTGRPYDMTVQQLIDAATGQNGQSGDPFSRLPTSTQAALRQAQAANPGGTYNFDIGGQKGTVPTLGGGQGGGFAGFAGPSDLLAATKLVNQQFDPAYDASKKLATGDVENFTKYKDTLNNRVQEGFSLARRNSEMASQLDAYQTGRLGQDGLLKLASTVQNMFPGNPAAQAVASKIAGGDVSSGQELQALFAGAALNNLKQTLDGQGRINAAEFRAFQQHSESLMSDPQALRKIMDFQNKIYGQDYAEQQALASAQKNGSLSPATWQADWAAQQKDQFLQPSAPAGGAKTATMADIAATAKASGKSTAEVTAALRAKGYTIGGQ